MTPIATGLGSYSRSHGDVAVLEDFLHRLHARNCAGKTAEDKGLQDHLDELPGRATGIQANLELPF